MDYTPEQVAAHVDLLKPLEALGLGNGNRLARVRTQVYESLLVDGQVIRLERDKDGRYGAGLVRVSTDLQDKFGFSMPEQTAKIIQDFVAKRQAFAIFSDASLSGGLPFNDPDLIQEIRSHKAAMYNDVFRAVFENELAAPPVQNKRDNAQGGEKYLKDHLTKILNGGYMVEANVMAGETLPRGKQRKPVTHRPGLTAVVETLGHMQGKGAVQGNIHTIRVTDLSRLVRSELVMSALLPLCHKYNVRIEGVYQNLEYLNQHDVGSKVMVVIYTHQADHTLWDVLMGALRGIRQKLLQGKYHGLPPYWITRKEKNDDGYLIEENAAGIRRMVELYLNDAEPNSDKSMTFVANQLHAEGIMARRGKPFRIAIIKDTLSNPNLYGYQEAFGFRWKVYPAVINEDTYLRLQEKIERRAGLYAHNRAPATFANYLMTGLLKCWCGHAMIARHGRSGQGYYLCCAPAHEQRIGRWHAKLRRDQVDPFFETLMQQHSEMVLEVIVANSDGAALMQELRDVEEQSLQNETKRKQIQEQRKQEAIRELIEGDDIPETDEEFPALLNDLLKRKTRDLRQQAAIEEKQIKTLREQIGLTRPKEEIERTREVLTRWVHLNTPQRNHVLKDIFLYLQFDGEKPNEYLMPHLRVARPDDVALPISVEYIARGKGERRLQDPGTWLAAMYASENAEETAAEGFFEDGQTNAPPYAVSVESWPADE